MADSPLSRLLSHFPDAKQHGDYWQARCPAHDDKQASLSISVNDQGAALLHCHAGCETQAILVKIGLQMSDLYPPKQAKRRVVATYDYKDATGKLVYQAVRYELKEFRQRRPDGAGGWLWNMAGVQRVPYRLPELLAASPDEWIFVVEGEKDADNLYKIGCVATTNVGGAGKWLPEYNQHFTERKVCILPDNDHAGLDHAAKVHATLSGIAADVRVLALPGLAAKEDVSNWLSRGGTRDELLKLVETAKQAIEVIEQATEAIEIINTPHYRLENGGVVYVKPKPIYKRGTGDIIDYDNMEYPVCNFSVGIASELRSCDGDETENMFSICGQTSDRPFKFDIPAEDLADQRKLQAALLVHAGGRGIVYAGQMKHVLPALQSLSNGYEREIRYVSTGWQRVGDDWIFVTPGGAVGVDLVRCDVAAELRNYRIVSGGAELANGAKALHYLLESFDHNITYPSVAHAFLAPLLRYLPNVKRYCLHLTGETGSLKTTFATVLLCLFGDFGNEDPTAKFGSTINSIEGLGHQAKDVLFVVDDFKPRYVKLDEITRLIQGYSDGHGRGRMNRDASLKATKYVRGALLTTGEDVPEHEASIIARSLILKMSRWDGKNENLAKAQGMAGELPAVMGAFIEYLLAADMSDVEQLITQKRDEFLAALSGQAVTNAGRIATNAAQNWLAFRYLCGWLENIDEWSGFVAEKALREHEEILLTLCGEMAGRISEEKASTTFVEAIRAIIASGEGVIIDRLSNEKDISGDRLINKEEPVGKMLLGWQDEDGIYMQSSTAFHAVEKWYRQIGQSIGFSTNALFDQLRADGLIIERSTSKKTNKGLVKVVHFSKEILDDNEESEGDLPF